VIQSSSGERAEVGNTVIIRLCAIHLESMLHSRSRKNLARQLLHHSHK